MRTTVFIIVALLLPFTGFAAETYQTDAGSHTKHYEQSLFNTTTARSVGGPSGYPNSIIYKLLPDRNMCDSF